MFQLHRDGFNIFVKILNFGKIQPCIEMGDFKIDFVDLKKSATFFRSIKSFFEVHNCCFIALLESLTKNCVFGAHSPLKHYCVGADGDVRKVLKDRAENGSH